MSKKKRERRVLLGAMIVAGVITAGSTFAWFTSKDEVTNRLTASANYGVSVVEDFTPPEDWTPGQKINKDVSAVNTGNVDAYVRLAFLNDLQLNVAGSGAAVESNADELPTPTAGESLVELKRTAVDESSQGADTNATKKVPNSVSTLQAGGTLVWTPDGAVKPTDAQNQSAGDDVPADTDNDYDGADQFLPNKTGLYLFRRLVGGTPKYSGYFYETVTGDTGGQGHYYALETESGTVNANGTFTTWTEGETGAPAENPTEILKSVAGVKLATTKDTTVPNTDTTNLISCEWFKGDVGDAAAANKLTTAGDTTATWLQLTYTAVTGNPIKLNIELAANWADYWTFVATDTTAPSVDQKNDLGYFYYKNILPAGNTTPKLIDSVSLDSTVTQDAYNEMVYDLTVVLESMQVNKSEDQATYTNDTAKTWLAGSTVEGSTGAVTWKAS